MNKNDILVLINPYLTYLLFITSLYLLELGVLRNIFCLTRQTTSQPTTVGIEYYRTHDH